MKAKRVLMQLRADNPAKAVTLLRDLANKIEGDPDQKQWELFDGSNEAVGRLYFPRKKGPVVVTCHDPMPSMKQWAKDRGIPLLQR